MVHLPRTCKFCGASLMHYGRCGCAGEKAKCLPTDFENALADLVEIYLRDGLPPEQVNAVLRARADDDYSQFMTAEDPCETHDGEGLPILSLAAGNRKDGA
jgi:hypothetical protein